MPAFCILNIILIIDLWNRVLVTLKLDKTWKWGFSASINVVQMSIWTQKQQQLHSEGLQAWAEVDQQWLEVEEAFQAQSGEEEDHLGSWLVVEEHHLQLQDHQLPNLSRYSLSNQNLKINWALKLTNRISQIRNLKKLPKTSVKIIWEISRQIKN